MPIIIDQMCPGCRKFSQTGDFFHEKEDWDKWHNSGWTDGKSDWQPREELKEELNHLKAAWEKSKEMQKEALQNYVNEHGHYPGEIPDWKLGKILKRRGL
jgi:hypothetical protein